VLSLLAEVPDGVSAHAPIDPRRSRTTACAKAPPRPPAALGAVQLDHRTRPLECRLVEMLLRIDRPRFVGDALLGEIVEIDGRQSRATAGDQAEARVQVSGRQPHGEIEHTEVGAGERCRTSDGARPTGAEEHRGSTGSNAPEGRNGASPCTRMPTPLSVTRQAVAGPSRRGSRIEPVKSKG